MKPWFEVDKEGLKALIEGKKKTFVINELTQNAWDEDIKYCKINICWQRGKVQLSVEDDSPKGFRKMEDMFTLYADTYKRGDPTKRGRFNLGEKLVLAICSNYGAEISTTKGTIVFHPKKGRINRYSVKREKGSIFTGAFKATKKEYEEILEHTKILLPPSGIKYIVNGEVIPSKPVFKSFKSKLKTEILENNMMRTVVRETTINLVESSGQSYIYEMGIPITETGCNWHIDVQQKIPLTTDRETVKPSYIQDLYSEVVNHTSNDIPKDDVSSSWVRKGCEDKRIKKGALETVMKKRFSDKYLSRSPFDDTANDDAISHGYKVISGSQMSKGEWQQVKEHELMQSTAQKFGKGTTPSRTIEPNLNQKRFAEFAKKVAKEFLGIDIDVKFVKTKGRSNAADYGNRTLTFVVNMLPGTFFDNGVTTANLDLLIHELAHEKGHHTEIGYHNAITKLGADLVLKALEEPYFFELNGMLGENL